MTTMQDVANLARVSSKTVSRVYNDDPHVDPATRARVQAAMESLNYIPNTMARSFRSGNSGAVGVAVPDIADPFFAAIARAVEDQARAKGMAVIMTSLGQDPDQEQASVESLLRRQLAGLVIAPTGPDHRYLKRWMDRTPTVFVDRAPVGISADSFVDDDHGGAVVAVEHLIDGGHRRVAFIGDTVDLPTTRNRLVGYRDALERRGIPVDESLVITGVVDRASAVEVLSALNEHPSPPSALFLSNARISMDCVPALQQLGRNDLAFVGFGDFPLADAVCPPVTVIDQNPAEIGRQAIMRIFNRIDHPDRRFRRRTVLEVELIQRESCSPRVHTKRHRRS